MTKINLKSDEFYSYSEICVTGHSGYAEEGSDIICAYISSACELLMNILIDSMGLDVETEIDADKAKIHLYLLPSERNLSVKDAICGIMNGFSLQMKELARQYPKFVSITFA